MTFGKGTQLVPDRKRAAPTKAIGGRRTSKESRKQARKPMQAYAQVQQATDDNKSEPRDENDEDDEDDEDDDDDDSSACIPSHYEQFTGGV